MHQRKTTPKVRDGRVQKKNRTQLSGDYYLGNLTEFVVDRQRPGEGYRHVLMKRDVEAFISILPDWNELSVGLHAIVLSPGESNLMGWHRPGVVGICAWERDLWIDCNDSFFKEHEDIITRLGVPSEQKGNIFLCKFSEASARAFQLLHILLHELGHHHDRMTTKSKIQSSRGESFAEMYARRYGDQIFGRYTEMFSLH
ncbi:MAG: hypothetical protein HY298_03090 [Verrucomicrobia bacterium]|nr:hypothetical protein [Verrucomicrobiota bacterium]